MKQRRYAKYWILAIILWGSSTIVAEPFAKGPYLGQAPPGPIAQVFAPGLISDTRPQVWESNGTFSADGNAFCYFRCSVYRLPRVGGVFITENTSQGWTKPKLIRSIREYDPSAWGPCLSPDANSIYFTRGLTQPRSKRNLFRCDRTEDGWGVPYVLAPPLSSASELTCCIAMNNTLYFGSGRKGGDTKSLIWYAPFVDKTWPKAINHTVQGGDPGIAPDESFIVFTYLNRPEGYGVRDIYLSLRLPDGTWSKPRNMGPRINTAYYEHSPRISPDKKYLFFTRSTGWDPRGVDSADIYWVELKEYLLESYR
jgi:hypothetical protein